MGILLLWELTKSRLTMIGSFELSNNTWWSQWDLYLHPLIHNNCDVTMKNILQYNAV